MLSPMRLKEKVIIVTGSTQGIGEAIARRAVREGARVMVHGLERELGEKVVADLGDAARLHVEDLVDPACPEHLVEKTVEAFGRLDCIVNNAAWVARSDIATTDADYFDRVMAINARAPLLLIRAGLAQLSTHRGCVLNIGSVNAWSGEPSLLAYSISKGGLMTMTRNLGDVLHVEHGVRVNQVNPGWVLTENESKMQIEMGNPEDWYKRVPKYFAPSGTLIMPDDIATAAIYWMGDESRPVSGTVLELAQAPVLGRNPSKDIFGGQ